MRLLLLAAILCLTALDEAAAQIRGISYTASPVGEYVFFADNAGLEPGFLYGGELGFGFGQFVELGGVYLLNDELTTDFSRIKGVGSLTRDLLTGISGRRVGMRRYGGNLKVNLSTGSIVPYLRLGAGVLRLEPEDLDATSTIYLLGGAGLQLNQQGRYTITASIQNLLYRYNLASTLFSEEDAATIGFVTENFNRTQVANWALRLGLKVYLGGGDTGLGEDVDAAFRQQFGGGLRNLRLRVEPFAGAIQFGDDLDFQRSHALIGASAGLDLGPFVGLRGFFWQATDTDAPLRTAALTAYGLESRFGFSTGWRSLSPFIILGGGYLDAAESYEGPEGSPDDQPFVTGGLGLALPLTDRIRLQASGRALLMSTEEPEDLATTSHVERSMLYSAGVSFALGGSAPVLPSAQRTAAREVPADRTARAAALLAAMDALETGDTLAFYRAMAGVRTAEPSESERSNVSERTITVPVPEEGEIILRFGKTPESTTAVPPDAVTAASPLTTEEPLTRENFEARVQAEVQRQLALYGAAGGGSTDPDVARQLAAIESRLQQRMLQEILLLRDDLAAIRGVQITGGDTVITTSLQPRRRFLGRDLRAVSVYTGGRFGEGPYRFLLGTRGDLQIHGSRLRLLPEAALGFGSGSPSFTLLANAGVPLSFNVRGAVPYVGAGAGLTSEQFLSGLGLVLNLFTGIEIPLGNHVAFGEFSTLDFLSYNRFVVGYRLAL